MESYKNKKFGLDTGKMSSSSSSSSSYKAFDYGNEESSRNRSRMPAGIEDSYDNSDDNLDLDINTGRSSCASSEGSVTEAETYRNRDSDFDDITLRAKATSNDDSSSVMETLRNRDQHSDIDEREMHGLPLKNGSKQKCAIPRASIQFTGGDCSDRNSHSSNEVGPRYGKSRRNFRNCPDDFSRSSDQYSPRSSSSSSSDDILPVKCRVHTPFTPENDVGEIVPPFDEQCLTSSSVSSLASNSPSGSYRQKQPRSIGSSHDLVGNQTFTSRTSRMSTSRVSSSTSVSSGQTNRITQHGNDDAYQQWLENKSKQKSREAALRKKQEEEKRKYEEERKKKAEEEYEQWLKKKQAEKNAQPSTITFAKSKIKTSMGSNASNSSSSATSKSRFAAGTSSGSRLSASSSSTASRMSRSAVTPIRSDSTSSRSFEEDQNPKSGVSLAAWERKKIEEKKKMEMKKRQAEATQMQQAEERKKQAEDAWNLWASKAAKKPKPVPMNRGFFSLKGTVSDIFINPNEWRDILPEDNRN